MEGINYWQMVWGGTWMDRQKINEAAAELGDLSSATSRLDTLVARLFELDRLQGREIARAQAAIWVLMQMLAEKGVLDMDELSGRVQQAFKELEPKAESSAPGPGATPYRG